MLRRRGRRSRRAAHHGRRQHELEARQDVEVGLRAGARFRTKVSASQPPLARCTVADAPVELVVEQARGEPDQADVERDVGREQASVQRFVRPPTVYGAGLASGRGSHRRREDETPRRRPASGRPRRGRSRIRPAGSRSQVQTGIAGRDDAGPALERLAAGNAASPRMPRSRATGRPRWSPTAAGQFPSRQSLPAWIRGRRSRSSSTRASATSSAYASPATS